MRHKRKKMVCADCGKRCYPQLHHEPPRSEGGTETVALCRQCHIARHIRRNDWARWGQKGGLRTAQQPANWLRNLKQYKAIDWDKDYVL